MCGGEGEDDRGGRDLEAYREGREMDSGGDL
jgi:hypothetical protein